MSSVASTGNEAGQSHVYTEQGVSWGERKTQEMIRIECIVLFYCTSFILSKKKRKKVKYLFQIAKCLIVLLRLVLLTVSYKRTPFFLNVASNKKINK